VSRKFQVFSAGLSAGEQGNRWSRPNWCHPAPSSVSSANASWLTWLADFLQMKVHYVDADVRQHEPTPRAGQTAPNKQAHL
jgi:hypothetical protein